MSYPLLDLVQRLGTPRILVLGDLILDRYIWGDAERVSQEAPVILLRADKQEIRLGGAGNVANLLKGLEAQVTLAGVIGNDADGLLVTRELETCGVNVEPLLPDPARPTTVKERYIGRAQQRHPHQMLRVDREVRDPLSAEMTTRLLEKLLPLIPRHQVVLVSDYAKGVCTPEIVQAVIARAKQHNIPVMVDPHPGENYQLYRGATGVTPNRLETFRATGVQVKTQADAFVAGKQLCDQLDLDFAYITLDSDGMALVRKNGEAEMLPTRRREVYDITGAGDMVLATIGAGLAAGLNPDDIGRLANIAGGLEVEQIGVVRITRHQIVADILRHSQLSGVKLCTRDELVRQVEARRRVGQRIVLTNGCFDLLHVGHVNSLQQAAQEGDCLIVAINSDASVKRLNKGPERPLFSQDDRAAMLAALQAVNYVTIFDEDTPHALLEAVKPDLLVKGGTYSHDEIVGWEVVEAYGGQVKPLGVVPGISTTAIVEKLRKQSSDSVSHNSSFPGTIALNLDQTVPPTPQHSRRAG